MKRILNKKQIRKTFKILDKKYPKAMTGLKYSTTFELLVATILSAQCTDKRVNIVTKELFKIANTPEDILKLGIKDLKRIIKSCGLSNSKSRNIYKTSEILIKDFDSKVPDSKSKLMKLPGVGPKTANVVLAVGFKVPTIPVDTHVFRVSNRIGLVNEKTVKKCEKKLEKRLDKERWIRWHHLLIHHGRNLCKARNPKCEDCPINNLCIYFKLQNEKE